jgi:hypothetical protein
MSIEEEIFHACDEGKRDWSSEERDFIRSSSPIRRVLINWYSVSQNLCVDCWTPENERFLEDLMKEGSL